MDCHYSISESYTQAPTNANFELHNHSDYEIFLFLEGTPNMWWRTISTLWSRGT